MTATRRVVIQDTAAAGEQKQRLQVSAYERVASMMLSMLILVIVTVVILLSVWFSSRFLGSQIAVPVKLEQIDEMGTGEGSIGDSTEYDVPPGEKLDFEQPEVRDTLAVVADAVAAQAGGLEDPVLGDTPQGSPYGQGGRGGYGNNPYGKGGKPGRIRRWEIQFAEENTLETYAQQLDYFKIELGVLMPDDKVIYVYNLSKAVPDQRTGSVDAEKRYYLTWRRGDLEQADRELFGRAGVNTERRPILKFLPAEVEATLVQLERERAGNDVKNIRKTRFGIRREGAGFAFFVIDQSYSFLNSN